jgi:hypothetical protein
LLVVVVALTTKLLTTLTVEAVEDSKEDEEVLNQLQIIKVVGEDAKNLVIVDLTHLTTMLMVAH